MFWVLDVTCERKLDLKAHPFAIYYKQKLILSFYKDLLHLTHIKNVLFAPYAFPFIKRCSCIPDVGRDNLPCEQKKSIFWKTD